MTVPGTPPRAGGAGACYQQGMDSLVSRDKAEAKKKGYVALGAWGGTAVLGLVVGAPLVLTAAAGGGAAYFTYKWFMYRAKRGMRF